MAAAAVTLEQIDWENPEQIGLWRDAWQRFRRNPIAVGGLIFVCLLVLDALLAPLLVSLHLIADPLKQNVANTYAGFSLQHLLGTDYLGRDLMSRVMFGARISLSIGLIVQAIYLAIGVIGWVDLSRLIRGQVLSLKEKEFVEGARAAGSGPSKIILRHLLPNTLGPIIVSLTFGIPRAIFLEATLSYLGVGIPPPTPSWGIMIQDGYQAIFAYPHQVLVPALALAITMLSFSFIGDGLRDAIDPRMRR